jgi:hypothetical protein
MRKALANAVTDPDKRPPAGTLNALVAKGLCLADGIPTPLGRVCGISLLPLHRQCQILDVPLTDHSVDLTQTSPELALMDSYTRAGASCCFTEGGIIFVALYSLCFERLLRLGIAKWGNAGYAATIKGKTRTPVQSMMYSSIIVYQEFLPTASDLEDNLLKDIEATSVSEAMKNFELLRSWQSDEKWFPHSYIGITQGLVQLVLERLPRATFVEIARLFSSDPYAYVKGWPDLTLIDEEGVRFVEVKTTDRLHPSQIITIGDMKAAAGLCVSVERVVG